MTAYKNCPNCSGTLDDAGRCKFCGSKIYDFCDIDLNHPNKKTYLRIKYQNQTITAQVYARPQITLTCRTDCASVIEAEFTVLEAIVEKESD